MLAHMAFDVYKYRTKEKMTWHRTARAATRESLPDLALLMLCLTFAVYLNYSAEMIAGLSGLLHAEVSVFRAMASVLPKLGISMRLVKVLTHGHPQFLGKGRHRKPFSILEWVSAVGFVFLLLLLLIAPRLLLVDPHIEQEIILEHLSPWRF
jgi:hypothetical protein